MRTMIAFVFFTGCLAAPAIGLDVSGKVVTRLWVGIPDARVCAQAGSPCVQSGPDGSFRLQGTVGFTPLGAAAEGFSLGYDHGILVLTAPASLDARLEWFDADGRLLLPVSWAAFSLGANAVAEPGSIGEGLRFLRVTGDGFAATWKILLNGKPGTGTALILRMDGAGKASGFLAKAAAAPAIQVTKAGYAASTYQPGNETETGAIVLLSPEGENTALLFDGKTLNGWDQSSKKIGDAPGSWIVQDEALHSVGNIRGTLSSKGDYDSFRLLFTLRHLPSTGSDHMPCVIIWGTRPPPNDALGGIQFQPPNGGHWDYRPGKNNAGAGFTSVAHDKIDRAQWAQCEIWAKASTGEARMACCNLGATGPCKGLEVLKFKDATAGKKGPIGLQVHNTGLHDQYKNISIELDPKLDDLITTK